MLLGLGILRISFDEFAKRSDGVIDKSQFDEGVSKVVSGFEQIGIQMNRDTISFDRFVRLFQAAIGQAKVVVVRWFCGIASYCLFKILGGLLQVILLPMNETSQVPCTGIFRFVAQDLPAKSFRL